MASVLPNLPPLRTIIIKRSLVSPYITILDEKSLFIPMSNDMEKFLKRRFLNQYICFFLVSFVAYLLFLRLDYFTFDKNRNGIFLLFKEYPEIISPLHRVEARQDSGSLRSSISGYQNNVLSITGDVSRSDIGSRNSTGEKRLDACEGKYIYVYDLPSRFNDDLVKDCKSLVTWFDICPSLRNDGLGPQVEDSGTVLFKTKRWFATNQFTLEIIFRNRMKQYKCLTNDSSLASAVFVPFYAGLDVGRHLWGFNISTRDSLASDLVKWLDKRPEWKKMWGRDHFLIGGRVAWDFRRKSDNESDWGNKLMFLPQSKNMTMLSIESSIYRNEIAVPYPTYFHPSRNSELIKWQDEMRRIKRQHLFSFVGAPRPKDKGSIRSELINQCQAWKDRCFLLDCNPAKNDCGNPLVVMKVFQNSVFCLQPPGDSYTRRSTFDSILAGCIPVFFHPASAYRQYLWHLPKNFTTYSVFIPEKDVKQGNFSISQTLLRMPSSVVLAMKEEVIKMIPRIIYADPRPKSNHFEYEDAFDIAIKGVLERIDKVRKTISEGRDPSPGFSDADDKKFISVVTVEE